MQNSTWHHTVLRCACTRWCATKRLVNAKRLTFFELDPGRVTTARQHPDLARCTFLLADARNADDTLVDYLCTIFKDAADDSSDTEALIDQTRDLLAEVAPAFARHTSAQQTTLVLGLFEVSGSFLPVRAWHRYLSVNLPHATPASHIPTLCHVRPHKRAPPASSPPTPPAAAAPATAHLAHAVQRASLQDPWLRA